MPHPNGVDIANMYVGSYGIEPQGKNENNFCFRTRVAQVLRSKRMIVDAHEVQSNRYHDEGPYKGSDVNISDTPVADGCIGAAALALAGHGNLNSTVIDLAAKGVLDEEDRKKNDGMADALLMLVSALGRR